QAEDGIRDLTVTGVQTCALPIYEVLLACNHLEYLHMGEVISKELYRIIDKFCLNNTVFSISTDNGSNMIKAVNVLNQLLPTIKRDRKSTRLNSSHSQISYAVFCL